MSVRKPVAAVVLGDEMHVICDDGTTWRRIGAGGYVQGPVVPGTLADPDRDKPKPPGAGFASRSSQTLG